MRFIIVGCGRTGSGLAHALSLRGHSVAVIDQDPKAFERLGKWFKEQTVLGEGSSRDVLIQAGVGQADGLAAVTSCDETNIAAACLARREFHVPKVVARVYDPRQAELYQRLGLQTVCSTEWAVNCMADTLCYCQLDTKATLGGGEVDIVETEVPALLAGRPAKELAIPGEAHVVAVSREGRTFLSEPDTVFQPGDLVHLAIRDASVNRLKMLLATA